MKKQVDEVSHYIIDPLNLVEAAYPGNLGFEELCAFYKKANDDEMTEMEELVSKEDWEGFKELIQKVTKVKLKG